MSSFWCHNFKLASRKNCRAIRSFFSECEFLRFSMGRKVLSLLKRVSLFEIVTTWMCVQVSEWKLQASFQSFSSSFSPIIKMKITGDVLLLLALNQATNSRTIVSKMAQNLLPKGALQRGSLLLSILIQVTKRHLPTEWLLRHLLDYCVSSPRWTAICSSAMGVGRSLAIFMPGKLKFKRP